MAYKKKHIAILLFCLIVPFIGWAGDNGKSLDWANRAMWFEGEQRLNNVDCNRPDVFYLLPTCIMPWTDEGGVQHFNADPLRADHRKAWQLSAELADTIFATQANLFMPYYRQATFGALEGENSIIPGRIAKKDAIEAFDYYLTNLNNGRPFILAGYSQGGLLVKELLKHMDDKTFSRMIAAYVVGFGITASDTTRTEGQATTHIRLATDSISLGTTINFNSVTQPNAMCPLLCQDNIGCINPVSWTTTATPALLLSAGQKPKADDKRFPYGTAVVAKSEGCSVSVRVDTLNHVLIVDGINAQRYFLEPFHDLFPLGNLHLQELFFYADNLRHNVLLRSNEYKKQHQSLTTEK